VIGPHASVELGGHARVEFEHAAPRSKFVLGERDGYGGLGDHAPWFWAAPHCGERT
jgi:hypothetical protein